MKQALTETAEALEYLVDETLKAMNRGATLHDILLHVKVPKVVL